MVTTLRSVLGWSATIGACALVTLFSLSGTWVRAYTEECLPSSYEQLDTDQKHVVSKMIDKIDELIWKNKAVAEKIMLVFEKLLTDSAMSPAKKAVISVLHEYYKNLSSGVCTDDSETSLREDLLRGLQKEDKNTGNTSGRNKPIKNTTCPQVLPPNPPEGCTLVEWVDEQWCKSFVVACEWTTSCPEALPPEPKEGCKLVEKKTDAWCKYYIQECSNTEKMCSNATKPVETTWCVVTKVKNERQGCYEYKLDCNATTPPSPEECPRALPPVPKEGCKLVEKKTEKGCVYYREECPASGSWSNTECINRPFPRTNPGCTTSPVKDSKWCIIDFTVSCTPEDGKEPPVDDEDACPAVKKPTPPTGCTVTEIVDAKWCKNYRFACTNIGRNSGR